MKFNSLSDAEDAYEKLRLVLDEQKGEMLFLGALFTSLMQSMPEELKSDVIGRFDKKVESVRNALLFSQASDAVTSSFEHYVSTLQSRAPKTP